MEPINKKVLRKKVDQQNQNYNFQFSKNDLNSSEITATPKMDRSSLSPDNSRQSIKINGASTMVGCRSPRNRPCVDPQMHLNLNKSAVLRNNRYRHHLNDKAYGHPQTDRYQIDVPGYVSRQLSQMNYNPDEQILANQLN